MWCGTVAQKEICYGMVHWQLLMGTSLHSLFESPHKTLRQTIGCWVIGGALHVLHTIVGQERAKLFRTELGAIIGH